MGDSTTPVRHRAWQLLKIALALLLIGYGVWLIVPRLNEVSSTDAVISARVLMVRAPVAGSLTEAPRSGGAWIQKGQPVARIEPGNDAITLKGFDDEVRVLNAKILFLETQYNANEVLKKSPEGADKRADLMIAQTSLGATLVEMRKRLEIVQAATDRSKTAAAVVSAPIDGMIWRALEVPGSQVAAHSPILQMLDASNFFVDCSVHRDDVQFIQAGAKVPVKVLGQPQWLEGTVESVLSPVSYDEQADFAVAGPRVRSNEYRVLVRLPPQGDRMTGAALALGVRATVVFGHRSKILESLLTLSR